jgi:hypothetical protein
VAFSSLIMAVCGEMTQKAISNWLESVSALGAG